MSELPLILHTPKMGEMNRMSSLSLSKETFLEDIALNQGPLENIRVGEI